MVSQELDIIIRVAGATLLLWAAFARRGASSGTRTFFIPLALCLTGFLAGNTPDAEIQLSGVSGRIGVILAGYAAAFLWWWCLAVFDHAFRPRGLVLATGVAWIAIASADRGLFGQALEDRGLSWVLVTLGLTMVAHLAWRLIRDRADDLIDRRRRARGAVIAVLAGQLLLDLGLDLAFGLDWGPQSFTILQNAALLAFTAWLLTLDPAPGTPVQAPAIPRLIPRPAFPPAEFGADPILAARLRKLMEVDHLYLDPDLGFDDFVRAMAAPERAVRRLINQQLGHDHFRTFLNAYRVAEARRRLAAPEHRSDKLIAIALDSGFASLPSFNRVFRDLQGCSPSAFRAASRPSSEELSAGI